MYPYERIYRSLVFQMRVVLPSGVHAIEGESYGIRLDDPTGKPPSVTVTIEEQSSAQVELGSTASRYSVMYTIDAKSRVQRDALKSILYSVLSTSEVPIYTAFDDYTPASGAIIEAYGQIGDNLIIRDLPNFDSGRERFFWTAIVFADITIVGV